MTKYAATTDVPAEKSRAEIEATLRRYGATGFAYGWESLPPDGLLGNIKPDTPHREYPTLAHRTSEPRAT